MIKQIAVLGMRPLFKNRVYTVRNGLAKGLRRQGGLGFLPRFMDAEQEFLSRQDLLGRTVYDVGGWEGVFTLFFSRAVGPRGRVVTFEPNPNNHCIIQENLSLNGFWNVILRPVALGSAPLSGTLAVCHNNSGTGSIRKELKSEILNRKKAKVYEVLVDTLDGQIVAHHLPAPDFIKMDVEGMELDVLRGMENTIRRNKPKLMIEVHVCGPDDKGDNAQSVVEWIAERGYAIRHVESDQMIDRINAAQVAGQHIYCSRECI